MLKLEPGMIIWTWITFGVVLVLLKRFAWQPLLAMVEERENKIAESLRRADEARDQAEALLEEQQKRLAQAQDEIEAMLKESRAMAERTREEILAKAREDANRMLERAKADIERERQAALLSLKKEVADLVVTATGRLIGMNLDDEKHRRLIDEYIQEIGKAN
ncbi:MAG: ATP synthase F0 subunit B [Calditrichaeota bacterium]|nr:MAG: ATP synthase F0 subunit B [Calditrichota bacterium]